MCQKGKAQGRDADFYLKNKISKRLNVDSVFFVTDTTAYLLKARADYVLLDVMQNACKQKVYVYGRQVNYTMVPGYGVFNHTGQGSAGEAPSFLTVHGSIMYEGFYQSNIDTPFIQKNIYQHTVTAALDVTVKDKYPLRVYFTTRFSNASFLKNLTDLNFQFNNRDFRNRINNNILAWSKQQLPLTDSLNKLEALINKNRSEFNTLSNWLSNPGTLQSIVEEREKKWIADKIQSAVSNDSLQNTYSSLAGNKLPSVNDFTAGHRHFNADEIETMLLKKRKKDDEDKDSTVTKKYAGLDSTAASVTANYDKNRKKLAQLKQKLDSLQKIYLADKKKLTGQVDSLNNIFQNNKNPNNILSSVKGGQIPDSLLPKGYKTLLAMRSVGIGRSTVNFSELSIKNISINGIEAEYNPSTYFAVAAGTIDYRFRDFIINEASPQKQYVTAIRFGNGMRDGNHLFVTYYAGRKQVYNYGSDSGGTVRTSPNYNLMGWSVEGRYQLNKTSYLVAEAAKSSLPFYNRQQNKQNLLAGAFRFTDRSNEAYSLNLVSVIPTTATKINATYKRLGANFQSFSMFTTSSAQTAWALQVSQPFFKNTLLVNGSVKKNDFTNPYINQAFYTNTVFKSIQVTLRMKKLPVISAGYYPSSQLTKLGTDNYVENLFYTLVVTGSHFYKYHSLLMSTVVSYTQFYNKATDSNFVYFNTRNVMLSQSFLLTKATLQLNASAATNNDYNLYTIGGDAQYKLLKWLALGGSIKYNRQTVINNKQVGYGANATLKIKGVGDIQFMMQKSYIPGPDKQLVENNIGRLIYYKTF